MNDINKFTPKVIIPPSVPKPKKFDLCIELRKLKQAIGKNAGLIDIYPTEHYIGLVYTSAISTNLRAKSCAPTDLTILYSIYTEYLNILLEIILTSNDRISNLSVNELNDLLISLANVQVKSYQGKIDINTEAILELIFNSKIYKGGYNSLSINELLITIGKSLNAHILYSKLVNYLIRDKFKFTEPNLEYLFYRLGYFRQYNEIENLFSFLTQNQPEILTLRIFNQLIKGSCVDKKYDLAEGFIRKMKEKNLKSNSSIYSWLITGYGKSKNYIKVIEVLNDYLHSHNNSNSSMSPIQAAIKQLSQSADNLPYVEELIKKTTHFKKDLDYYNSIIHYNVFKGNIKAAMETLQQIKKHNYIPNAYSYNCLLDYFVKTKDLQQMEKTYTDFLISYKSASSKTSKISMQNIGKIFVTKYTELACNTNNPILAESLISQTKENSLHISLSAYYSIIKYYSKHSQYKEIIRLYQEIKDRQLGYDIIIFNMYLKATYEIYGAERGINEFFNMLKTTSHKLTEKDVIMNALRIGAYGTAKDLANFFTHHLIKPLVTKGCYDAAYQGLLTRYNNGDIEQILKFNNLESNSLTH